jgi:hypothetical protein
MPEVRTRGLHAQVYGVHVPCTCTGIRAFEPGFGHLPIRLYNVYLS